VDAMTVIAKPNKKNIIKLQNFIAQNYGVHKSQPNTQHSQINKPKP
jgi:hypothetical protein